MEFKHFSHNHGLVSHHIPPAAAASECNGCNSPASGNLFVCWQCNYFLHDHCFRATRSLKHFSHPHHPLTLLPFPTYPSASFICNSCHAPGHGFSYSCSLCEFDLHVHCAHTSNVPNPNFNNTTSPNLINSQPQLHPIYPLPPPPPQVQTNSLPSYHFQNPPVIQNQPPNYPINPPQTNQFVNPPPNPTNPPPPQQQPNPTVPTYSTVVNATSAATDPPVSQPTNFPQSSNPQQPKPPSIIRHFSHPHILKAMEIDKSNAKVCSACECELSGSAYCCTEPHCTFNLHKSCFDSPQEVKHKSHLQHPLKLLSAPPYSDGFTCNACLKDGKAFAYTCEACSYDLHIDCIQWPDTVVRPDHKHTLTLYYSSPAAEMGQDLTFMCDVCKNPVHELAWLYYCRECDFGTHLECIATAVKAGSGGGSGTGGEKTQEELMRETELKFAMLQILLNAQGRQTILDLI